MLVLLLHPPLLSPVVWRAAAEVLRDRGHQPVVPRLRLDPVPTWWRTATDDALAACADPDVVVAHSGAGVLVPLVVAATRARAVVLVDAVLPAPSGSTLPSEDLRERVRELAVDGVLPRWTRWWSEELLATEVPDAADRRALDETAPELPEAFYDVAVPVPDAWEPPARAYLRLSAAYDDHAEEAARRGWRVAARDGRHLDVLTDAEPVVAAVLSLLERP